MMSSRLKGLPVRSPGLEGPLYFLLTIICRNIGRRPNSTTFTQSVLLKHLFLQNSSDACSRSFREIILTSSQPFSSNYHKIFSVIHLAPSPGNLPCIHPAHINILARYRYNGGVSVCDEKVTTSWIVEDGNIYNGGAYMIFVIFLHGQNLG